MIVQRLVSAGAGVTRESVRVVQGTASHVLWWFDHNSGGRARRAPADPRRQRRSSR